MRRWRLIGLVAALQWGAVAAPAQNQPVQELPIFDAHLHYNQEAMTLYPLDRALDVFRRNNVTGLLATSRPNTGTNQLFETRPEGLWVVPFLRPYRVRSDTRSWSTDPAIWELIQAEYKTGYYRGIGEFHLYGAGAENEVARQVVAFAREKDLWLHCHCDEEALVGILAQHARAKVIWAHTGFTTPPPRVRELLDRHPGVIAEMSYRSGITEGGKLTAEWRDLFATHSDRVVLGSDTWITERWFGYDGLMKEYRGWLAQLPPDQARRIAYGNGERLFGGKMGRPGGER